MTRGGIVHTNMDIVTTLTHVRDLAEENTKGCDGYELIHEWCIKQLRTLEMKGI